MSAAALTSGVRGLIIGLPQERVQSYLWLVSGRDDSHGVPARRQAPSGPGDSGGPGCPERPAGPAPAQSRSALNTLLTELGRLGTTRAAIDSGAMSPPAVFGAYNSIIDHLFVYFDTSVQNRGASLTGISVGASDSGYAFEMTTREIALVAGALLDHGQMSEAARTLFAGSVANRRLLMNEAIALMTPSLNAGYVSLENSSAYQRFQTMESQILASTGRTVPVNAGDWQSASLAVVGAMEKTQLDSANQLTAISASQSDRLVTEAVLAGGLGLLAVVVSVFLLVWFGRKVTRDLGGLNDSVRGMAEERLPRVVEQLRRGDDVDVAAESPPPGTSTIQEISRIAESFGTVQAAAVTAAVDQARLRKGVNQVFLNISMRNQSLLHRQLGMLDSMERRTSEPEALADLFRLDHLTTRMQRHAEGLIILSGSVPGRGWRDPVPVVDVLRAALAEVEDYVRVDVISETDDLVAGSAVNDVIHLVAELVENAAAFSPPNTRIEVRAERVGTAWSRRSKTAAWACPPTNSRTSTGAWPAHPSSTWRAASSSGCSSSATWRPGMTSRSRSAGPCTAAPRPWSCCRSAWSCGRKRPPPGRRDDGSGDGGFRAVTGRHRLAAIALGAQRGQRAPVQREWPAASGATAP